jgi:cell division protein FtsB
MWNARSILAAASLITLILVGVGILSPNGLPKTKQLQAEAVKLERQVQEQERKNKSLKEEIDLLNSDAHDARRFQEHVIRQELGFVKDDEIVLLMPPKDSLSPKKQADKVAQPLLKETPPH